MSFNKRIQDVEKVFDDRWKINNDYIGRKAFLDGRKEHFKKMYNIQDRNDRKQEFLHVNSVNGKIENLNQKMNAVNDNARLSKMNDLRKNFR